MNEVESRLAALESRNRRLSAAAATILVMVLGIVGLQLFGANRLQAQRQQSVLTASELVIVDTSGKVRVRIGTELPDAVIRGKTRPRGDKAAGLILYDETGQERGGYVTFGSSGYVGLTVDSRDQMVGSFMAGPSGGAMLQIRDGGLVQIRRNADWIELRADESGPHMNAVRSGQLASRIPTMSSGDVRFLCSKLRQELMEKAKMPAGKALEVCKERMMPADCNRCFAAP